MSDSSNAPGEHPASADSAAPAEIDIPATHISKDWQHSSPLISCRFDPTGKYVFTTSTDRTIQRWDLSDGKAVTLAGHDSWLQAVGFSPDGQSLYSGGYDGQLIFWDALANEPVAKLKIDAHQGWIRALAVRPWGQIIVTAGNDGLVKLWSAADGQLVRQLSGHESHIYSLLFHPEGAELLSGDLSGKILQWNIDTGQLTRTLEAAELHTYNDGQGAHYGGVRSMTLSHDGKSLAGSGLHKATNPFGAVQEPLAVVLNWESGQKVRSQDAEGIPGGILWRAIYHASGPLIGGSGGSSGGFVLFWKPDEDKAFHKFQLPNTVLDLDLHPNQIDIATAHYDGHVRISRMQPAPG